jgi:hypothetical protein
MLGRCARLLRPVPLRERPHRRLRRLKLPHVLPQLHHWSRKRVWLLPRRRCSPERPRHYPAPADLRH